MVEEYVVSSKDYSGITAEDMLDIFQREYPKTFYYWFRFCNKLYIAEHGLGDKESTEEEKKFWDNDAINFATTILYDCPKDFAAKVGKILVAATE